MLKHKRIEAVINNELFDDISNSDSEVSSSSSTQDILSAIALEQNKEDCEINALSLELNADACTENISLREETSGNNGLGEESSSSEVSLYYTTSMI